MYRKSKRILNNEKVWEKAVELEKEYNDLFLNAANKYIASCRDAEMIKNYPLLVVSVTLRKCTLSMGVEYSDRLNRDEDFGYWLLSYEYAGSFFIEFWNVFKETHENYKAKFAELGKEIIPVKVYPNADNFETLKDYNRITSKYLNLYLNENISKEDFLKLSTKTKERAKQLNLI